MRKLMPRIAFGVIVAAALAHGLARAGSPYINADQSGLAIKGYDPVAYFTDGAPEPGVPAYAYAWNGATWLFASAAHRDAFAADPARYAPQFGGYCAYAVAKGHTASADPRVWAIVDGKLYLNLAPGVQQMWEADRSALIASALGNWPDVLQDPAKSPAATGADR